MNRGKTSLEGVAEKALKLDADKAAIIDSWRADLGKMRFLRIAENGLNFVPPLVYAKGINLSRDFEANAIRRKRIKSAATVPSEKTSLKVKRPQNTLSELFGIPVLSPKEINNRKVDAAMQISADSSNRIVITFKPIPELVEVGPQIRISHLAWKQNR